MSSRDHLVGMLNNGKITAYIGFDLTAPSLHVGSLIQPEVLRLLREHGHRAIVGSATTMIGDPTGKDTMRPMLTREEIEINRSGITRVIQRIVGQDVVFVDNEDWMSGMSALTYLRDFGPHFTLNRMLTLDSVKSRLDRLQPMTFLELNYLLFQSIDFLELHQQNGVTVQIGGSDQWGNIVGGVDLIRRVNGKTAVGIDDQICADARACVLEGDHIIRMGKKRVFNVQLVWES